LQGATLDLHEESGLKVLREAGLMEALKTNLRSGVEKLRFMGDNQLVTVSIALQNVSLCGRKFTNGSFDRVIWRQIAHGIHF
jgi:hypothetical protein